MIRRTEYDGPILFTFDRGDLCLIEGEVHVSARAWDDPGCYSGPPERCYPAEGDCETEIESVAIDGGRTVSEAELRRRYPRFLAWLENWVAERIYDHLEEPEREPDYEYYVGMR